MRKLFSLALLTGMAAAAIALPAATADASVTAKASEAKWSLHTKNFSKALTKGRFKITRTGKVYIKLTNTGGVDSLKLRLVTCDKRHVSFTDWRYTYLKDYMKKNKYYVMTAKEKPRTMKKGTCFMVQADKLFHKSLTINGKVKDAKAL
ncbi:hypothetical protein GCM10029978_005990 [Actinoallomurus acanthiterrae]